MLTLTYIRRRTLEAIRDERARFHFEAGEVRDAKTGRVHTAEFRRFIAAGWIRAAKPEELWPPELSFRTYYRIDDEGAKRLAAVQKGHTHR